MAESVIDDPTGYGRIVRDSAGGFVGIVEDKQCTPEQRKVREVNPSYYCFRAGPLFRALHEVGNQNKQGEYYLTDLIGILNRRGARVGKGGGYSDIELGLLVDGGLVDVGTVLVTTVHPLQVLEEELPETEHDFRVHLVVTPEAVIRTGARGRPAGILWDHLDDRKIADIPALSAQAERLPPGRAGRETPGRS